MEHGLVSALNDIAGILRDIRGRDTIVRRSTDVAGSDLIGDIDLNQVLLQTPFSVPFVNRITFINIPTNVTQFQVRLNFLDAPVIDVLLSGNTIVSTKTINRVFISANPVIPELVKMITGDLQVFDSTGGVRPAPAAAAAAGDTVRSRLFTHTMIAGDDLTLLWPRVPSNESHVYDSFAVQHDDSSASPQFHVRLSVESPSTFALSRRTVAEHANFDDDSRMNLIGVNQLQSAIDVGQTATSPLSELRVYPDERLILQMYGRVLAASFDIGTMIRVQYRLRVEGPSLAFTEDTQAIVAVESEFEEPEP